MLFFCQKPSDVGAIVLHVRQREVLCQQDSRTKSNKHTAVDEASRGCRNARIADLNLRKLVTTKAEEFNTKTVHLDVIRIRSLVDVLHVAVVAGGVAVNRIPWHKLSG